MDADAEDTPRVLAVALLEGKKGWHPAAEAMQADPPEYVSVEDAKAFDETLDGLLDHLHEVMLTDRGRRR